MVLIDIINILFECSCLFQAIVNEAEKAHVEHEFDELIEDHVSNHFLSY